MFVLVLIVCCSWVWCNSTLNKVLVADALVKQFGAASLDGTPPGYYFGAGSPTQFVIATYGGAWCESIESCYARSQTLLGSSSLWPDTAAGEGLLDNDPKANPTFANFTKVHILYTDGNSQTGFLDEPIVYNNTNVYFRGYANLQAIAAQLILQHGLLNATEVLVTGCSAGGLSTFIHADFWSALLPQARVVAVPVSGFFLPTNNVDGDNVYVAFMQKAYALHNASALTVDRSCAKGFPGKEWMCMFAPFSMPYMTTPVFPLQSFYDSWQMGNEYFVNEPTDAKCAASGPTQCSATEIKEVGKFRDSMSGYLSTGLAGNHKSGVFAHSCWTHCLAYTSVGLDSQGIINGVSMQQAVTKWYNSPDDQASNMHIDCKLTKSNKCNPTCPA